VPFNFVLREERMEENSLRFILIAVGVGVLLVIYFYDKWTKRAKGTDKTFEKTAVPTARIEPVVDTEVSFSAVFEDEKVVDSVVKKVTETAVAIEPEERFPLGEQAPVIKLIIQPADSTAMQGAELLTIFTEFGLEFGEMDIFHYCEREGDVVVQQFHVANFLEPGVFPIDNMAGFESTGLVLFFQENNSLKAAASFRSMLAMAQQLSQILGANLMAADMQELTIDKINDIRSQLSKLPH